MLDCFDEMILRRWITSFDSVAAKDHETNEKVPVVSMQREKRGGITSFEKNELFEIPFRGYDRAKNRFLYLVNVIAEKYVRPQLADGKECELIEQLSPSLRPEISENQDIPLGMSRLFLGSLTPVQLTLQSSGIFGEAEFTFYSYRGAFVKKQRFHRCWMRTDSQKRVVVDFSMYLAELIIFSKVKEKLTLLKSLSPKEREEDIFYDWLVRCYVRLRRSEISLPVATRYDAIEKLVNSEVKVTRKERSFHGTTEEFIAVYFMKEQFRLSPELWETALCDGYNSLVPSIVASLFMVFAKEYQEDKQTYRYCKSVSEGYAASYQDKRNVPQRTKDAANASLFRKYFSEVEYDETVDLRKAQKVGEDFETLAKVFSLSELSGYTLRFRLLGKHHASGLYFPFQQCLCVDVREPGSMAHELLHLLDFRLGCKSKGVSFAEIRRKYEQLVEAEVKKNEELTAKWNGSTKYNKRYYLEPTEIFARCGELYLTRVLKLKNSCVSPESASGFAYPEDDSFLRLVEEYFNLFLENKERNVA